MAIMQALMMGASGKIGDTTVIGELWGWGDGGVGALGNSLAVDVSVPTQVTGGGSIWTSNIAQAGVMGYNIRSDGTLWATGQNDVGQLGQGDVVNRSVFTQVGVASNWVQVSSQDPTTDGFMMATDSDGKLWGTGNNGHGALGIGDLVNRSVMTQIGSDTDWAGVVCGFNFSIAIKTTGSIWGSGTNNLGQLGLGDKTARSVMTQIGSDTDWLGIMVNVTNSYERVWAIKTA